MDKLELQEGDITRIPADAIVNAANSALAGGGGVDGAIHRAAGPGMMLELDAIRRQTGGCRTGSAVATGAGNLPARYVFHAVGPVYRDGRHGEPELLASCYRKCLAMAEERGVRSISFPAISTGVYGYPMEAAARIAIGEVRAHFEQPEARIERVIFVVFGTAALKTYRRALGGAVGSS
jgi:O-acetyl-ADP-ribose deacetylase (regulator of RNase III)